MKFLIIFSLILTSSLASGQDWKGIGKGVGCLRIDGDIISGYSCHRKYYLIAESIKPGINKVSYINRESGEEYFSFQIEIFGSEIDSIQMLSQKGDLIETFYNESIHKKINSYDRIQLSYEIYSHPNLVLQKRYEISSDNTVYITNHKRDIIKSFILSSEEISRLKNLISRIDIVSINECFGETMSSHPDLHSFTFIDWNGKKYSYVTQDLSWNLKSIVDFLKFKENH